MERAKRACISMAQKFDAGKCYLLFSHSRVDTWMQPAPVDSGVPKGRVSMPVFVLLNAAPTFLRGDN